MEVSHLTIRTLRPVERGLSLKLSPARVYAIILLLGWIDACASTPAPLTLPSVEIQQPAFRTSLEAFAGAPIVGDNLVDILLNGEQTFPAILDAIRSARDTVTFESYIFHEGKVADEIIEALVGRCRAGVRVAMLLDAHGSKGLPERYIQALETAGCMIVPDFRPLRIWNLEQTNKRNHRRIVVVDGRVGFTGGVQVRAAHGIAELGAKLEDVADLDRGLDPDRVPVDRVAGRRRGQSRARRRPARRPAR